MSSKDQMYSNPFKKPANRSYFVDENVKLRQIAAEESISHREVRKNFNSAKFDFQDMLATKYVSNKYSFGKMYPEKVSRLPAHHRSLPNTLTLESGTFNTSTDETRQNYPHNVDLSPRKSNNAAGSILGYRKLLKQEKETAKTAATHSNVRARKAQGQLSVVKSQMNTAIHNNKAFSVTGNL